MVAGQVIPTVSDLLAAAQTNLDLYRQLHRAGYDADALREMRDAYQLALRLFSDRVRATGKPFVAHLVGTASILAALGAAKATIVAGLLHAAYQGGNFPGEGARVTPSKRHAVRSVIGGEAEDLVVRYADFIWKAGTISNIAAQLDAMGTSDRVLVLMRLANELEDHLGLAMRYCEPSRDGLREYRDVCIAMAARLGHPGLAEALAAVYRETDAGDWAAALATGHEESYRLPSDLPIGLRPLARAFIDAAVRRIRALLS